MFSLSRHFYTPSSPNILLFFFFFNDTATTEIYTLSLHDALPIFKGNVTLGSLRIRQDYMLGTGLIPAVALPVAGEGRKDRKSTRLNSSHTVISYAVFCLKKKKAHTKDNHREFMYINTIPDTIRDV